MGKVKNMYPDKLTEAQYSYLRENTSFYNTAKQVNILGRVWVTVITVMMLFVSTNLNANRYGSDLYARGVATFHVAVLKP